MKHIITTILATFVSTISFGAVTAADLTIQSLPSAPEELYPVCRDDAGKLANCVPNVGVDRVFFAPVAIDGNGHTIGTYVGSNYPDIEIVSFTNYRTTINEFDGTIKEQGGSFLFLTTDCVGEMYHFDSQLPRPYSVYQVNNAYYSSEELVEITFFSNINPPDTTCNPNPAGSDVHAVEVFPNDPVITYIKNKGTLADPYLLPIRLTRP